jgi:VWFA-related protein
MTRGFVCAAAAVATWAVGAQNPQQPPVFRSAASAVAVDVSVHDASRRVVADLTSADFVVLDNGVPQQVEDVSYGRLPIDVTIGLDISGSVGGPLLDRLRAGVHQLMADLRPDDRLKLMVFNMRFSQTIDFTTDASQVDRALRDAGAAGGTALFDALSVALITADQPGRRQLIVFFTDGTDTSSTTLPATLQKVAERSRATVSFVLLPTVSRAGPAAPPAGGSKTTAMLPGLLGNGMGLPGQTITIVDPAINRLAVDTGGVVLTTGSGTNLGVAFLQALDRFRAAYVLYFSPRGVDRTGFHSLTVTVNRPGAVVEARRGYFGG